MAPIPLSFPRISSNDIGFVRMSAKLSLPAILHRANFHSLTACWTHRTLVSMCRSFPTPDRFAMDRAVLESTWMIRRISHPRSRANAWMPIPSQAASTKARYSASPLERASVACVKLQCFIADPPMVTTPPDVDRRVRTQSWRTRRWCWSRTRPS